MTSWWQGIRDKVAVARQSAASSDAPADAALRAKAAVSRGNAALAEGRLADAARCYQEAMDADPTDAPAHVNLAYALLEQGHAAPSAECSRRALALRSAGDQHVPDAWYLLGLARHQLGDSGGALDAYEGALRLRPSFDAAIRSAFPLLIDAGRTADALQLARRLAESQPDPASDVLVAHALYALGQDAAALDVLDGVLREHPNHEAALAGRGHALLRLGDYEGAAAAFGHSLEQHGPDPDRFANLASALHRQGRIEESADLAREAARLDPSNATALNLRVVNLTEQLRLGEAETVAREALRLHSADADLHWSLGVALLLQGKLREGWAEHGWRWRTSAMATTAPGARPEPAWRGEALDGRSLLLVAEQGVGDMIQFVRYVPRLASAAGHVILQAAPALQPLLRDLAPNCELVDPSAMVRADLHCALMDVPAILEIEPERDGSAIPYLAADPARVKAWRERLGHDARLKVGIVCSGNPAHTNDRHRSIPLQDWAPLLTGDAHFISLQPQLRASDAAASAGLPLDLGPARDLRDFAETAALLEALDLVITVDTSVAHLAGALGRPVWILLPHCPDWRWMVDRADSPWYPTARLFRQQRRGDWGPVLASVQQELQHLQATRRPSE